MEACRHTFAPAAFVAAAVLCLSAHVLPAEQFGLFTYRVVDDAVWVTRYPTTEVGEVAIPAEIDGMPVTVIGGAFEGCSGLTNITIPEGVTDIDGAFEGCSGLTNITIPEGVTGIGCVTFRRCSGLTRITIPSGVTEIGEDAFYGCSGLRDITIQNGVTYIGEYAFYGCSGLRDITIPGSVTVLRGSAFHDCESLTSAVFLGDAPRHGSSVFWGADPGFTVYYLSTSSGFSSPTWEGYPAVEIDVEAHPAAPWLLEHGKPYDADLTEDDNGDGFSLLVAYALDLDPNENLHSHLPVPVVEDGEATIIFYGDAPGVTYRVESSTDLIEWTVEGVTLTDPEPDGTRKATLSGDSPQRFVRLVVSQ